MTTSLLVRDIANSWCPKTIGYVSSSFVDDEEANVFNCETCDDFTMKTPLVNRELLLQSNNIEVGVDVDFETLGRVRRVWRIVDHEYDQ